VNTVAETHEMILSGRAEADAEGAFTGSELGYVRQIHESGGFVAFLAAQPRPGRRVQAPVAVSRRSS
jgi:hypothetical protein